MSFFTNATFTFPSDNNDINTWADYCELFSIITENKSQTIDELKDRLLDQYHQDSKSALNSIRLSGSRTGKFIIESMGLSIVQEAEEIEEEVIELEYEDVSETQQDNNSILEDRINEEFLFLFRFLEARKNLFDDCYPFDIKHNKLSLLPMPLSDKQTIYISLLLSSLLRIYNPAIRNHLGHLFEILTVHPFKRMIAHQSNIEFFGAGIKRKSKPFFNGSFAEKVEKLAEILQSDTSTIFKQNRHDYLHGGDGGLDWVGWTPFSDNMSKMPVFFGQCACGEDWVDKEWDAHDDKWINLIQLNDSYLLFHFVSKSFRKQDGKWYKPGEIYKLILVDRLRILSVLTKYQLKIAANLYRELIEEVLSIGLSGND